MIHGPTCRKRHVGYDKLWGCLIVYHPLKHHSTPSYTTYRTVYHRLWGGGWYTIRLFQILLYQTCRLRQVGPCIIGFKDVGTTTVPKHVCEFSMIGQIIPLEWFFGIEGHAALDKNPWPAYSTVYPSDWLYLCNACPHRQFHIPPSLLHNRNALPNRETVYTSFLWYLVWPDRGANLRPTTWDADTLTTKPDRRGLIDQCNCFVKYIFHVNWSVTVTKLGNPCCKKKVQHNKVYFKVKHITLRSVIYVGVKHCIMFKHTPKSKAWNKCNIYVMCVHHLQNVRPSETIHRCFTIEY